MMFDNQYRQQVIRCICFVSLLFHFQHMICYVFKKMVGECLQIIFVCSSNQVFQSNAIYVGCILQFSCHVFLVAFLGIKLVVMSWSDSVMLTRIFICAEPLMFLIQLLLSAFGLLWTLRMLSMPHVKQNIVMFAQDVCKFAQAVDAFGLPMHDGKYCTSDSSINGMCFNCLYYSMTPSIGWAVNYFVSILVLVLNQVHDRI